MTKKSISMRGSPEFRELAKLCGFSIAQATRELARQRTIISEMVGNEKFKKQIEKMYREFKGINI